MITIAIDPGASGALVYSKDGEVVCFKCPKTMGDMNELVKAVAENKDGRCVIEQVHSMPKQGVVSVWSFSGNYHTWKALLVAHGIPFKEVTPQKWMKKIKAWPKDKKERKNAIKAYAQNLYPSLKVTLANADALAMLSIFDKIWNDV